MAYAIVNSSTTATVAWTWNDGNSSCVVDDLTRMEWEHYAAFNPTTADTVTFTPAAEAYLASEMGRIATLVATTYTNVTTETICELMPASPEVIEKRDRARAKAENLFYDLVGKRAYNRFRKVGYHQVFGVSGRRYRLYEDSGVRVMKGKSGNKVAHGLCIILGEYAPSMDKLVALILAFKSSPSSEANALRIGNRYEVAA
jgi:hypothetical protein